MSAESEASELAILKAVQALDTKLTAALTRQTSTLSTQIQALADRHSEAILDQEKRNASFADRNRVEAVAEHVHSASNHIQNLLLRVTNNEKRILELAAEINECRISIADRAVGLLSGANGYLVTFIIMLAVAVSAAVLARLLR